MNKKGFIILFSLIAFLTGVLVTVGQVITSKEQEKPYFTGEYSIGREGRIAYVIEKEGTQMLYIQSRTGGAKKIYEADERRDIKSPVFRGENHIAFVSTTGPPEAPPGEQEFQLVHSNILAVHIENTEKMELLDARGYINDLLYDAAADRFIVNGVHMSMKEAPEEGFIPYESELYTLEEGGKLKKLRSFDVYSPSSLQVGEEGEALFMVLPDDFKNVTAESMYQATERIFKMNLDKPNELTVIGKKDSDVPVSEFVMFADETTMLYQTIMNWGEGERYLYDYVWFDRETKEEDRLHLNKAVMNSNLNEDETWLFYVREGDETNKDHLYRFDLSGEKGEEKINLQMPKAD